MSMSVVLHAIGFEMGAYTDIGALPQVQENPALDAVLRRRGLGRFAASDLDITELARRACLKTLEATDLDAGRVDALVFATATFDIGGINFRSVRELHAALGLVHAQPFGVFGTDCANLMTALRVGLDLLRGSGLEHVLVVTSDRARPAGRLLDHYAAVYSDGAVSCLLSTPGAAGAGGFEIEAVSLTCSPKLCGIEDEDPLGAYLHGFLEGATATLDRCLRDADLEKTSIDWLLTGNLNRSVLRGYAYSLGVPDSRLLFENAARFGHSFAADPLLNAHYLLQAGRLREGHHCVLLGAGFNTWGASALRVRQVGTADTASGDARAEAIIAGGRS
jgi:3-oxoacyl-[acyl-carrier-protein] synthase III